MFLFWVKLEFWIVEDVNHVNLNSYSNESINVRNMEYFENDPYKL